jgi:ABC-2 type transport system permease protein
MPTKLLLETWLLAVANLKVTLRSPVWVIMGLFQPLCYLLLFAPLLEGVAGSGGLPKDNTLGWFIPGLLVLMAIYGTAFVGFGLIANLRAGVIERLRVTPVSRLALLLGLMLRDVIVFLTQCLLLLLMAVLFGLRPNPLGLVLALVFLVLIGLMMTAYSYAVALLVKEEGALAASINALMLPLTLLSGFFLPLTPRWLQVIALFNPFAYAVEAARALFAGNLISWEVPVGFGLFAVLAAVTMSWAIRAMRQATT